MEIRRTANAGVLLRLDGKNILLDGVSQEEAPYLATPPELRQELLGEKLDALVFTHSHIDHYDPLFVSEYLQNTAGPIMGPAEIPCSSQETARLGPVTVTPVPCRHVGKTDAEHRCYIIQGSRCVWFMGDASLLHWMGTGEHPKPDVLIVPYGFVLGKGWQYCKDLAPAAVVVLHLPEKGNDPYGLWDATEKAIAECPGPQVLIPGMGQRIEKD